MDTLTPRQRSDRMSRVRSKDTGPELAVRGLLRSMGYGYRLHRRDLPGTPDLVLSRSRTAIFVHGCFWHRHDDASCRLARLPKSRLDFWLPKLEANRERDAKRIADLARAGWTVLVVWECQIRDIAALRERLRDRLGPPSRELRRAHPGRDVQRRSQPDEAHLDTAS